MYDGKETILPSYLVGYRASIESIERVEKLNITSILVPHYGVLGREETRFFLDNMKAAAERTAGELLDGLKNGLKDEEIIERFKEKYWHGYIKETYPEDALHLNTSIMINLIKNELL